MSKLGLIPSLLLGFLVQGGPLAALDIGLSSSARMTSETIQDPDVYDLPIGPFSDGSADVKKIQGNILRQSWRIDGDSQSSLQIMSSLRTQLEEDGFEIILDCHSKTCGGFDFRFNTEVIPAPDMHVDLFDYQFLSAFQRSENRNNFISLLTSRSTTAGYVQIVYVAPTGASIAKISIGSGAITQPLTPVGIGSSRPLLEVLEATGHAVLPDLIFQTGSSQLGKETFSSLGVLASYLNSNPSQKVILVGHTDAEGSLSGNITLSKHRANSVVDRLVETYSVPRNQVSGEGMGYLAPIASNLSQEGRDANRRVEVVLLNTE